MFALSLLFSLLPGRSVCRSPVKDVAAVKKINDRCQQTIAGPAEVDGIGYVTGKTIRLCFRPAPANTGVVFVRTDLGHVACINACVANVTGTARRTTLGNAPVHVSLVEHVLAALSGLRIDNCYVELDAPEAPGMDGSAQAFVNALHRAGIIAQNDRIGIWTVDHTIFFTRGDATIAIHPTDLPELRISYLLDYGKESPIPWQMATMRVTPGDFAADIAPCRTFVTEDEAISLKNSGIGSRSTVADLLVFGAHGPIQNTVRFGNEPARHKILDIIGDLALLGCDLRGHIVAFKTGHPHNVELARTLSTHLQSVLPRQRRVA